MFTYNSCYRFGVFAPFGSYSSLATHCLDFPLVSSPRGTNFGEITQTNSMYVVKLNTFLTEWCSISETSNINARNQDVTRIKIKKTITRVDRNIQRFKRNCLCEYMRVDTVCRYIHLNMEHCVFEITTS